MSLAAGSVSKARDANELLTALSRGRNDQAFFWHFFLSRNPHAGQQEFLENSQATINALACANRYGKTTLLAGLHLHGHVYKTGGEDRYFRDDGTIDADAFFKLKYETAHTAGEYEQVEEVVTDTHRLIEENAPLKAFVKNYPKSKPHHIDFVHGSKWKFRTLGVNASGVDGKSLYILSIDEAGWIDDLDTMMGNVLRVRVADVRGRIVIVGTFKPGISKDFYKVCVRASAYTGRGIGFAHGSDTDDSSLNSGLDSAIRRYLKDFGIDLDEYLDAMRGQSS